jgi:hypothetical protein
LDGSGAIKSSESHQARVALVQDVNYDVTRTFRDYKDSSFGVEVSNLLGIAAAPKREYSRTSGNPAASKRVA